MRLFIAGQKWLGRELLKQCLASGHRVLGVAVPDLGDSLAVAAAAHDIPAIAVTRRLEPSAVPDGVDLILCAHAHCFVSTEARARATLGAIGYHPSLLPRHRGRDAIRWALHMGERVTGGTIYWIDDGADTGAIALQDWCHIQPGDDAAALWRRELGPMGLRLFRRAIELAGNGLLPAVPQAPALATWEPAWHGRRLADP